MPNESKLRSLSPEREKALPSHATKDGPSKMPKGCWASAGAATRTMSGEGSAGGGGGGGQGGGGGRWGMVKQKVEVKDEEYEHQRWNTMKETLTFDALFKRYELAKAFSLDSEQVRKDAGRVKTRLYESNRFLLNADSKVMQIWDGFTVIALLFTLLVSPYEIGYLDEYDGPAATVLFWINQLLTLIFATDCIFNFFLPYRDALSQKVKSHRKIAINYMKGWFIVDILSTVPFDIIGEVLMNDPTGESTKSLKMIRLARLLKLFRIVRASRVFARWADRIEHYISISHSTRTLIWWIFLLVTVVHWFCCLWGLIHQLHGSQRDDAMKAYLELHHATLCPLDPEPIGCMPTDPFDAPQCANVCLSPCELKVKAEIGSDGLQWNAQVAYNNENWICRAIAEGKISTDAREHFYRYSYVASVFGQINKTNVVEYVAAYIMGMAWLMMQNAFIGILCGTIADGDRHAKEYKQRMDELNFFLRDMDAPQELAVRAREHCRATRGLFKKVAYQKLFPMMSPMLRGDLAQQMSLRTLENVWYFSSCEAEFMRALSEKLKPHGYARSEKVYYEERINIISRGAAARGGKILTLDAYWGEDMIVTSQALKDTRYASALTYLELTTVTRDDLEDCLVHFPKSERRIRVTALKIAMQRAGQIIAHHLQTRMRAKQLSGALARIDPKNKLFTDHAKEKDSENLLKEMMQLVNGGKKLRAFDEKQGNIVDESQQVIDDNYVRSLQRARALSTEESLLEIREQLQTLRSEMTQGLTEQREQIKKDREKALADASRGNGNGASGGNGGGDRRRSPSPPRHRDSFDISPSGTLTPPSGSSPEASPHRSKGSRGGGNGGGGGGAGGGGAFERSGSAGILARAGKEAAQKVLSKQGGGGGGGGGGGSSLEEVKMEKRYRKRKKNTVNGGGGSGGGNGSFNNGNGSDDQATGRNSPDAFDA